MSLLKSDPLLAFCRLLSWLILISAGCGFLFALCATIATLANGDFVIGMLRRSSYPQLHDEGLRAPFILGIALIALALALLGRFMLYLLAVIRSVANGEAFTLLNAARIRGMAWISLSGIAIGLLIGAAFGRAAFLLGPRAPEAGIRIVAPDNMAGCGQILMTLLLFVLARLFAQAAAMRDEIEGTV